MSITFKPREDIVTFAISIVNELSNFGLTPSIYAQCCDVVVFVSDINPLLVEHFETRVFEWSDLAKSAGICVECIPNDEFELMISLSHKNVDGHLVDLYDFTLFSNWLKIY
jgi:hypothetical protein